MDTRDLPAPTDFVGPSGNSTDKYESGNPVARALVGRFLQQIDLAITQAGPKSILDVGCGEGVVTSRLARLTGAPTTGVDLGDERLKAEWLRRPTEGLTFREASAYELPFADSSFDCVCAIEVLEHLERPRDALAEMVRAARRHILVSVPREPHWRISHLLGGRDMRDLGNTPGHIQHWSSSSFRRLVSEFGTVVDVRRPFPWTVVLLEKTRA